MTHETPGPHRTNPDDEEQAVDQTQPGNGEPAATEPAEPTEVIDPTGEPTEVIEATGEPAATEPTEVIDPTGEPGTGAPTEEVETPVPPPAASWAAPEDAAAEPPAAEPTRPRGPHAPTVLLGLICLLLAALVVASQSADVSVDWEVLGPGTIVGAGVVLVLLGLASVIRRER